MASREQDELAPYVIQELELLQQGQEQGAGSYGAVYRVKVRGFPCIAKRLHAILLGRVREVDVSDRQRAAILQRFCEECILLSKLRHPNIVQFIGVHYGQTPEDLTLVMECLYTDLDKCLQRCSRTKHIMPLSLQLGILLDVSYGLLYLHSQNPPIVHRDLTASNILLTEDMRAKLADLGVSRLLDLHPMSATAQTVCPGTPGVMPPEALVENPQYDAKLDDFSYGTLALHIVNHEFAMPFEVPNARRGEVHIARRRHAIEKMGADHCLSTLVIRCLQDDPRRRPTTATICATLEQLSRQHPKQFKDILELYVRLDQLQQANVELQTKLVQKEEQLDQKDEQLHEKDEQLDQKEVECGELQQQIRELHQREVEREAAVIANTHGASLPPLPFPSPENSVTSNSRDDTPSDSTESQPMTDSRPPLYQPPKRKESDITRGSRISWECHAPFKNCRGVSTIHGNIAFFNGFNSDTIHSYHTGNKVWDSLPPCRVKEFGLEVINGLVTTVGGCPSAYESSKPIKTLYTLMAEWKEVFPPMPTSHCQPATTQSGKLLIVAGGRGTSSVEILNTETKKWSPAPPLPQVFRLMSAAVCSDKLYLVGGYNKLDHATDKAFTCKVSDLLESSSHPKTVWKSIADAPLIAATCAAVKGEILAVGGRHGVRLKSMPGPSSNIYRYDPDSNFWELMIGRLPFPRFWPFVNALPGGKLMVVGGCVFNLGRNTTFEYTNIVEIGDLAQ